MPNWCSCELDISGPVQELDRFMKISTSVEDNGEPRVFSFMGSFPCPGELFKYTSPPRAQHGETELDYQNRVDRLMELYGCADWYTWCCNNWGTKWDACSPYVDWEMGENHAIIGFETAWAPPVDWLRNISHDFPELTFSLSYSEEGCAFEGDFIIKNEEIIADDCRDIIYYEIQDDEGEYIEMCRDKSEALRWAEEHVTSKRYRYVVVKCGEETIAEFGTKEKISDFNF